ncbi:MAG: GNAT family N-acetyltransferase [Christensenellaceae bacterium]|jgi:ribosomal protein S18 acetylase RimI-like enzyme|nr:GNAT family N-acetyltransferase [Christensenellaceae bacterium]
MPIAFRTYQNGDLFGADYRKVRDFLIKLDSPNYHFGRWDWMITHNHLDPSGLQKIGLWEDCGKLVALATYDCSLGRAYLLTLPGYEGLFGEMLPYAKAALQNGKGEFSVLIREGDLLWQDIAKNQGFFATQNGEKDAIFPIDDWQSIKIGLPEGFAITSMEENFNLFKYGQVLWKGFDHEQNGEGIFVWKPQGLPERESEFLRPNVKLRLKVAVMAPNGDFVSYCGMWQDEGSRSALVEPVATDPAYRRMGLGKAAVLEAIRRCGQLGAKRAFVGSSQAFYYAIGFRPYQSSSFWAVRD